MHWSNHNRPEEYCYSFNFLKSTPTDEYPYPDKGLDNYVLVKNLSRMLKKLSHSGKHAYERRLLVSRPYTYLSNIFKYPQYVINNYIVFIE